MNNSNSKTKSNFKLCKSCKVNTEGMRRYSLSAKLCQSNILLGMALLDAGIRPGPREEWKHQYCCFTCFCLVCKLNSRRMLFQETLCEWKARTGGGRRKPKNTAKRRLTKALLRGQYSTAFSVAAGTPSGLNGLMTTVSRTLRMEMKTLMKKRPSTMKDIKDFNWSNFISEAETAAPLTLSCLRAVLCKKESHMDYPMAHPRLGALLSIALFNRNSRKWKFMQSLVGIQLWQNGAPDKVSRCLYRLGVSQHPTSTRRTVDAVNKGLAEELADWDDSSGVAAALAT